jgi:hypothetical protein
MSRSSQRSTAIQSEANADNGGMDRPLAATQRELQAKVSLGWRLAAIVWVIGFSAVFGYELAGRVGFLVGLLVGILVGILLGVGAR